MIVIFASGMVPPVLSVMVPLMVPEIWLWAKDREAKMRMEPRRETSKEDFLGLWLIGPTLLLIVPKTREVYGSSTIVWFQDPTHTEMAALLASTVFATKTNVNRNIGNFS